MAPYVRELHWPVTTLARITPTTCAQARAVLRDHAPASAVASNCASIVASGPAIVGWNCPKGAAPRRV